MKIIKNKLFFHLSILFFFACSMNSGFQVYNMDGNKISLNNKRKYNSHAVKLFFDRAEIEANFKEVNVIASNHHYYGDFFYDDIFMSSLNKKVSLLDVDALIFEKDSSSFLFYKEGFIYFTAIKFKE